MNITSIRCLQGDSPQSEGNKCCSSFLSSKSTWRSCVRRTQTRTVLTKEARKCIFQPSSPYKTRKNLEPIGNIQHREVLWCSFSYWGNWSSKKWNNFALVPSASLWWDWRMNKPESLGLQNLEEWMEFWLMCRHRFVHLDPEKTSLCLGCCSPTNPTSMRKKTRVKFSRQPRRSLMFTHSN